MHRTASFRSLVVLAVFTCLGNMQHSSSNLLAGEPAGQLAEYAKSRTWSDATGNFKIVGQLNFASTEEIQLTQANGKTLKIAIAKLSTSDQQFVQSFLEAEQALHKGDGDSGSPFQVLGEMGTSNPSSSPVGNVAQGVGSPIDFAMRQPIIKGAKQVYAKLDKPFWSATPPLGFPEVQFDDMAIQTQLAKPFFAEMRVLSAGKAGISVLNAYGADIPTRKCYSRFVLVRAQDGFASDVLELNAIWKLMAISADGMRVAVLRIEDSDKGNDVGIFRVTPTGLVPEFQFTAGGGAWDDLHFVGFAAGNRLVTISRKFTLIVWDLAYEGGPKAIYLGNSGGSLHAALSPAGELMALPAGTSIAVIDTLSAKVVGLIARETKASQISFSQDGSLLAAFEPFEIALYNMSDGTLTRTLDVPEHREDTLLNWVGKHLLVGSVVYDVDRGLPLWTYEGEPTSRSTVGSYLVCGFGGEKSSSLTIQRVPHAGVLAEAASVDRENIYALRPGDAVKVDYTFNTTPADAQVEIRSAVEGKLKKLGWKISRNAPNALLVELQEGQPGTVEYRSRKLSSSIQPAPVVRPSPSDVTETVNFIPWTHKVSIMADGALVYQSTHVRTPYSGLLVREGESTQSAVTKYCQPSPDYFAQLPIPPQLLKLEFQGGLGKSKLTANGLP